jgi:hypothetical protein
MDKKILIINKISTVIFSIMSVLGFMYVIYMIGRQGNNIILPDDIAYTAIFIVGSFGLIIQLMAYNLKLKK